MIQAPKVFIAAATVAGSVALPAAALTVTPISSEIDLSVTAFRSLINSDDSLSQIEKDEDASTVAQGDGLGDLSADVTAASTKEGSEATFSGSVDAALSFDAADAGSFDVLTAGSTWQNIRSTLGSTVGTPNVFISYRFEYEFSIDEAAELTADYTSAMLDISTRRFPYFGYVFVAGEGNSGIISIGGDGTTSFLLDPGAYTLSFSLSSNPPVISYSSGASLFSGSVDWRIEAADTAIVPLPAGALLVLTGLCALGAVRRFG